MKEKKSEELIRALTLKDAVAVGLGAIIGAGIFVVTGTAAGVAGPAFIVSLVVAGIVATFNALSSAQLAIVYPHAGGTYEYGYRVLNPLAGFSAGWMFLISKLSAAGVVAIGFGSYVSQLTPVAPPLAFSVGAVVLLTMANFFGVKKVGLLNLVIVTITLCTLLYFTATGIFEFNVENFKPFTPYGITGIAEASALLFFAFTGYARIATLAEEVNEPEKTIPRAVIITIITAIVLYLSVSVVAVGMIGADRMVNSKSPLQVATASLSSPVANAIITIGASTAMLGVLLSQILGISRMMLAMGRRNDLPHIVESIHSRHKVPHIGVFTTGGIILLLTVIGSFDFIVRAASFTILLYYSITNIAALKQPANEQIYSKVIPLCGLAGCLIMSVSLPVNVIVSGVGLLVAGFIVRALIRRAYKKTH